MKWLQQKVFWNPFIRYVYLNGLKLSMASLLIIKVNGFAIGAICTLVGINVAVVLFVSALKLHKNHLTDAEKVKSIGSLYVGKNVHARQHKVHWYPFAFFLRRALFAIVTVYLFE